VNILNRIETFTHTWLIQCYCTHHTYIIQMIILLKYFYQQTECYCSYIHRRIHSLLECLFLYGVWVTHSFLFIQFACLGDMFSFFDGWIVNFHGFLYFKFFLDFFKFGVSFLNFFCYFVCLHDGNIDRVFTLHRRVFCCIQGDFRLRIKYCFVQDIFIFFNQLLLLDLFWEIFEKPVIKDVQNIFK